MQAPSDADPCKMKTTIRRTARRRAGLLAWWFGLALLVSPLIAAETQPVARFVFDLPAEPAEKSLLRFSAQSGQEVLFATQVVAGVVTKPVQGEFTAMEAVSAMLAGTGLVAARDRAGGVLTVRRFTPETMNPNIITKIRRMLSGVLLALTAHNSLPAQEKPASAASAQPAEAAASKDDVVTLSAFNVSTTQGKGYVANDASSGLKSKQLLIDIPQSIQIVPRDVIEDLGQFNSTIDTIKYVSSGVIPYGYGEVVFQRGFRSGNPLIDGQLDAIVVADSASYDSYEVLKGPAAVLYGQRADLAGIIIKHTKKPLSVARSSVRAMVGEGGFYRGEVDLTGPIGKLGSVPVSYRVVVASQKFDGFQPVDFDDRTVFSAGLKFDFNADTSLLVQADYFDTDNKGITNNFQNASLTDVYDGPGYAKGYKSKWSNVNFNRWWTKATLTHRFSENWEAVTALTGNFYDRKDREVRNAANPDYTAGTIKQYFFGFNYKESLAAYQTDVTGRYEIAGFKNQSSFGFSFDRTRSLSRQWLPGNIVPNFDTSITNPGTFDIAMPDYNFSNSSAPTRNQRINAYGYYMHTLELIEDKLSLVGGISGAYLNTSDRNLTTNVVQDMVQNGKPHRLGAVFKPLPGVALFVNNSTAFRGQGARDFAGNLFPAVEGEVTEGGFKTSLKDGRISTTVSYFKLEVSNLPVADPTHPGFSIPAGTQHNKGFEADIAVRPLENWSIIGSLYSGNILGVDGKRMASSINRSHSLLTKYDFTADGLKGLSIGASLFHSGDRAGAPWHAYTVYGAFIGYARDSWQVMVNLDNLTDEFYSPSGWGSQYMDVGAPRNAKVTFTYRF